MTLSVDGFTDITPAASRVAAASHAREWLDFLWLEVTRRCNLGCIHCYADSSPTVPLHQGVGPEDWGRLIDEAAEYGCRKIQFIGGEPTLYPALPRLIRQAAKARFGFIEIYTNGVRLSHEVKRAVLDCNVAVAFSIYANEPRIHDAVTGRQGSHARTIATLKWALASGLRVRVGVIATRPNTHAVAATRDFLAGLGVKSIAIDRQRGVGRGVQVQSASDPVAELCGRCWQGRLCVTATGQAYPCVFSRSYCLGSVQFGLGPVLRGPALAQFRAMTRERFSEDADLVDNASSQCGPLAPDCLPLGRPCAPDEFHPCLPEGGRPCIPQGGPCTPESPPCGPEGGCGPNAPPI